MRRFLPLILPALLLGACESNRAGPPTPELLVAPAFPRLSFENPLFLAAAPGDAQRLYVATQGGRVYAIPNIPDPAAAEVFLDIRSRVRSGGEEGLLGLAFDPGHADTGHFFVYYTAAGNPRRSVVSRFTASGNPRVGDPASEAVLLEIPQPYSNHNGGMLAFGPDGKLYIASGDGGSAGDPQDNAQNPGSLLGKILRLNPDGTVPADNPFVGVAGARGEIWALGLRNPWRFSFDRASGALWAGDVGQDAQEEVDLVVRGGNYGWRYFEGNAAFNNPDGRPASDFIAPVATYPHSQGCSVTGGYVYRGTRLPGFAGHYFYADFCSGRLWALAHDGARVVSHRQVGEVPNPSSFGEDAAGELYITSFDGRVYRLAPP